MNKGTVLVVDDEKHLARFLVKSLQSQGYLAEAAFDAESARRQIKETYPDVVLIDLRLPDADGAQLMVELKAEHPETEFLIITGFASVRSALEVARKGAFDYLTKPFDPGDMILAVRNAFRRKRIDDEIRALRSKVNFTQVPFRNPSQSAQEVQFPSACFSSVLDKVRELARGEEIVLFSGELGVGKHWLARWLHNHSSRCDGPFFYVNCAAYDSKHADSEIFGHEPGALSGAQGRKKGCLELAHGGTLLVEEVGHLDAELQEKLENFLESRSFVRLGGEHSLKSDARIVADYTGDLGSEVRDGRFHESLFKKLSVNNIRVPTLNERKHDIPLLIEEILDQLVIDLGMSKRPAITLQASGVMRGYDWPGNIRELRAVLEQTLMLSDQDTIEAEHILLEQSDDEWRFTVPFDSGKSLHDITREVARTLVSEALRRSETKQQAADVLGLSRHALAHQIKVLGIETDE